MCIAYQIYLQHIDDEQLQKFHKNNKNLWIAEKTKIILLLSRNTPTSQTTVGFPLNRDFYKIRRKKQQKCFEQFKDSNKHIFKDK